MPPTAQRLYVFQSRPLALSCQTCGCPKGRHAKQRVDGKQSRGGACEDTRCPCGLYVPPAEVP